MSWAEDPGVTSNNIRIGATSPWKGISKCTACNSDETRGMDPAALADQAVQKRRRFVTDQHFYNPTEAVKSGYAAYRKLFCNGQQLARRPTRAVLPLLAK
ncbi:MAG: hypothetical protein R3F40_03155 [Candidatus Competibacteraceae bacterium]